MHIRDDELGQTP